MSAEGAPVCFPSVKMMVAAHLGKGPPPGRPAPHRGRHVSERQAFLL